MVIAIINLVIISAIKYTLDRFIIIAIWLSISD